MFYIHVSKSSLFFHACASTFVFNGVTCLMFGLSLHLLPYFVYASTELSGETMRMHKFL